MRKITHGTLRSAIFVLSVLLIAGCSEEDSPVKQDDPPVIADLEIWYVNASASGACNGSSWDDAFTEIQEAVDFAEEGDQVWVANGSYFSPEPGDSSAPVLRMKAGVDMYGGFTTSDTSLEDRDAFTTHTVLDGENSIWHVVIGADRARLDGFIVQSGYAFGTFPDNCGGGMLNYRVSPVIENCVFTSNDASFHGAGMANFMCSPVVKNSHFRLNLAVNNGAGVYNDDQSGIDGCYQFEKCTFGPGNSCRFGAGMYNSWCEAEITKCTFRDNLANHNGGGLYNTSSLVTARSCTFTENRAANGGAVYMNGIAGEDISRLENCLIERNIGYSNGGGVYLYRSSSSIINCTIFNNSGTYGGGISCWLSEAEFFNVIVWSNTAYLLYPEIEIGSETVPEIRCCDIDQEGYGIEGSGLADLDGNIRLDPLFATGSQGEWYLSHVVAGQAADSPCIDAGTETSISAWLSGYTTRTDSGTDTGAIDIGFHYSP